MQLFEFALLGLGVILPFIISTKEGTRLTTIWLTIIGISSILHIIIEGVRWQMGLIYLIIGLIGIFLIKGYRLYYGHWFRKILTGLFVFTCLGLGFTLSSILPVFNLPEPSGEYIVASTNIPFNTDKAETITANPNDFRELMIKVWYPSTNDKFENEPFLNKAERIGLAKKYGLPKNTFNYLNKIKTNTQLNGEIATNKFPVLIFSHGYYSNATGYYSIIEDVVSHGFIVLNMNHTYESIASLFPNDSIKYYDSEYDKKHNNQEMSEMVWIAMEDFKKANNLEEKTKACQYAIKNYVAADITERWANDINSLVDVLPNWSENTILNGHIDFDKIGVLGHSQGGAATGQAVLDNSKIKAGINIDGVQWGKMIDTFQTKPFMLLSSDWPEDHANLNEIIFQNKSRSDFYNGKILESGHSNFMDIPLMINLPILNEAGSIDPKMASTITSTLIIDFFDKYLNNKKLDLLKIADRFPKLTIEYKSEKNEQY